MPNDDNIIPFRTRAVALSTCALPEYDDETAEDVAPLDDDEGAPILPIKIRPWHFEVFPHACGKVMIDACVPTHVARAIEALAREMLALIPATA